MDGAKLVPTVIRETKKNVASVSLFNISLLRKCFIRDVNVSKQSAGRMTAGK